MQEPNLNPDEAIARGLESLRKASLEKSSDSVTLMLKAPRTRNRRSVLVSTAIATCVVALGLATMTRPATAASQLRESLTQPVDFAKVDAVIQLEQGRKWKFTTVYYTKTALRQERYAQDGKLRSVSLTQGGESLYHDVTRNTWSRKKSRLNVQRFFYPSLTEDLIAEATVTKRTGVQFRRRLWDEYLVENDKQWFKVYVDGQNQRVSYIDCFIKDHVKLPAQNRDKRRQLISITYPNSLDEALFHLQAPPGMKLED